MKKSELVRMIAEEVSRITEAAGRRESFPGQNALSAAGRLCKEALDPNAVGAQLDDATKESFRQIHQNIAAAFNALAAKSKTNFKMQPLE